MAPIIIAFKTACLPPKIFTTRLLIQVITFAIAVTRTSMIGISALIIVTAAAIAVFIASNNKTNGLKLISTLSASSTWKVFLTSAINLFKSIIPASVSINAATISNNFPNTVPANVEIILIISLTTGTTYVVMRPIIFLRTPHKLLIIVNILFKILLTDSRLPLLLVNDLKKLIKESFTVLIISKRLIMSKISFKKFTKFPKISFELNDPIISYNASESLLLTTYNEVIISSIKLKSVV